MESENRNPSSWQPGIGQRLPWLGSPVQAQPLDNPRWLAWSDSLGQQLGLKPDQDTLALCAGQTSLPKQPGFAQVYSGHQFGGYTPRLGDGRGLHLGELAGLEVFLKGSGTTPYSRGGDGRAVLRSAVREFLASEALHHLGIATTRALGVLGSDTPVWRETQETGAVTIRTSPSHLRFGHFEYFYHTGQHDKLEALIDDTLQYHFPELLGSEHPKLAWLQAVAKRTAETIADWQAFGFCHGVLNSDNMSILGETFDYGPFAFLGAFEPHYICNHSDPEGRYAFDQQPGIGLWNLNRLAVTLTPWLSNEQLATALAAYEPALVARYQSRMSTRLGLQGSQESDMALYGGLLNLMQAAGADYTNTLRSLTQGAPQDDNNPLAQRLGQQPGWSAWRQAYLERLGEIPDLDAWLAARRQANPALVLRTHLAQQAIDAAEQGDNAPLQRLHRALTQPYDPKPEFTDYCQDPPPWSQQITLSCSS